MLKKLQNPPTKLDDKDVFCENSNYGRNNLKARFIKNGHVKYECVECKIGNTYNEKPISLQLDHKNGINNDNRIENLRLLCPNCHSQTETFSGKRLKKININKETESQREARIVATRKFNPSKEELEKLVKTMPFTKIGVMFGVTDNAIRKRCRLLKIDW